MTARMLPYNDGYRNTVVTIVPIQRRNLLVRLLVCQHGMATNYDRIHTDGGRSYVYEGTVCCGCGRILIERQVY